MTSSHPSDHHGSNLSPPIAAYIVTAILGGALALIAIRFFPSQFLPQDIYLSPQPVASTDINKISAFRSMPQSQPNLFRGAIEKVAPTVVKIESDRSLRIPIPPIFNDPSLERFFGSDRNAEIPYFHRSNDGSGLIVREDGMILTNAHIVSGADNIKVTLKDGRKFVGTLLGKDSKLDLAIVNINTDRLPVAPLGKSQDLKLGDWVISIGNPFGREQMVSLGIVSSLKYNDANNSRRLEWIQTDAVINSANSGGALINQKGEIVGINTAIRPDTKGIGFVIPIEKFVGSKNKLFTAK